MSLIEDESILLCGRQPSPWGFVLGLLSNLVEDIVSKIRLMANVNVLSLHLYLRMSLLII